MRDSPLFPTRKHQLLSQVLSEYFEGIEFVKCLNGYDDLNLLAKDIGGKKVVIKFTTAQGEMDFLKAQNKVLSDLDGSFFPHPVRGRDGQTLFRLSLADGTPGILRVLDFLPGTFLGEMVHSPALFYDFGGFMGRLDEQLKTVNYQAIRDRRSNWDMVYALNNVGLLAMIQDPQRGRMATKFLQQFREQVVPLRDVLPWQTIHGDANEWNTLAQGDEVTGLIDFGDMVYSWRIGEVAIALAYALLGKEDPLFWAGHFLRGYHAVIPLSEMEIRVLYVLVGVRMVVSVANAAKNRVDRPDNSYIFVSEKPGWEFLEGWVAISPLVAENAFRVACGFAPRTQNACAAP